MARAALFYVVRAVVVDERTYYLAACACRGFWLAVGMVTFQFKNVALSLF